MCAHDKSNSPTNCASDQPDSPKSVHGKMLGWQTRGVLLPAGIALCVYVCVWTCMRVCVGVCAYVYVCVYICIQLSPLALFAIQKLEVVNWRTRGSALWTVCRVGQNHICTVYIRCFWQGNHQLYGHIRCFYTVLANPKYKLNGWPLSSLCGLPAWLLCVWLGISSLLQHPKTSCGHPFFCMKESMLLSSCRQ